VLHSIELALKAHLAHAGLGKRELAAKKLGHNLAALVKMTTETATLSAIVDARDRKAIAWGEGLFEEDIRVSGVHGVDASNRALARDPASANKEC
jgi:hypothetical protein